MRWILIALMALASLAHGQSFETIVAPLASETFADPCAAMTLLCLLGGAQFELFG